jgi:hypothetical protein
MSTIFRRDSFSLNVIDDVYALFKYLYLTLGYIECSVNIIQMDVYGIFDAEIQCCINLDNIYLV